MPVRALPARRAKEACDRGVPRPPGRYRGPDHRRAGGRGETRVLVHGQHSGTAVSEAGGPGPAAGGPGGVEARRWLVDNLAGRLDTLAMEMADAYVAVARHRGGGKLSGWRAAEAATEQLLYLLRTAATGDAGDAGAGQELDALADLSFELAGAGCTLADVLDVCNASFLVAWEAVQEELSKLPAWAGASISSEVRQSLLAAMTRGTVVVSQVFQDERASDRADDSVLGRALSGEAGLDEARRRAHAAGWPVHSPHTVVAISCQHSDLCSRRMTGVHHALLEAIEGVRIAGRPPLTCMRNGSVVVAVAHDASEAGTPSERWRHIVAVLSPPPGYRLLVGVGFGEPGFAGIPASYAEALRALEVASGRGGERVVVSYRDVLPELLLLDSPALAGHLYRLAVEPLDRGRADTDELLASVEVYLDLGLNAMAASTALGVHRHTLAGRLQQVERCTGLRIDDGDQRLLLELGLRARRLLEQHALRG